MLRCKEDTCVVLWSRVQRKSVLQQLQNHDFLPRFFNQHKLWKQILYNLELLHWNPCKGGFPFGKKPSLDFPIKLIWVRNLILILIMAETFWHKKNIQTKTKNSVLLHGPHSKDLHVNHLCEKPAYHQYSVMSQ